MKAPYEFPIPLAIVTLGLSVFGLMANLLILLAIAKSKELHTRCYALIGVLAAVDAVECLYYGHLRVFILLRVLDLSNRTCFLWSVYGLLAMNAQAMLTLALGVDRLVAIAAPIRYHLCGHGKYIVLIGVPTVAYAVLVVLYAWLETSDTFIVGEQWRMSSF